MVKCIGIKENGDICNGDGRFGLPDGKAEYCSKHYDKKKHIKLKGHLCKYEDEKRCTKQPRYGPEGGKPIYCLTHNNLLNKGYVDLVTKKCCGKDGNKCTKQPSKGFIGEKPKWCTNCAPDGTINVQDRKCAYDDCEKIASFGYLNEKPKWCLTHKSEEHVNVRSAKCKHKGCFTQRTYGKDYDSGAEYCAKHKPENYVNVVDKSCIVEGCLTRPHYGPVNGKAIYCSQHKEKDHIDLKNRKCSTEGCLERAFYSNDNKTTLYCKKCRKDDMENLSNKKCINCNITTGWIDGKYCSSCYATLFPNTKRSNQYLFKQKTITEYLKNELEKDDVKFDIIDRKVSGGCSSRKPDLIIERYTHIINIEIDEEQHSGYEDICENKRLMELFEDFGNRPYVCIRFNPDDYKESEDKTIRSMFSRNIKLVVKKKEFDRRIKELLKEIRKWLKHIPDKEITLVKMFYDT